jgi:hypothetical protein
MPRYLVSNLLGALGAVVGGALGFYIFRWFYSYGFYGLMIPGGLLGAGCGLLARHPSQIRGVVCGIAAASFELFTEWWFRPFKADESISYFLAHLSSLTSTTWVMVVVGAIIAYWLAREAGFGRGGRPVSPEASDSRQPSAREA